MPRLDPDRIHYLPADLHRWDYHVDGDLVVLPLWSDVRPLRGPVGLCDWRLGGQLSTMIREERLSGSAREKTLLKTPRMPWGQLLLLGIGPKSEFSIPVFREALTDALESIQGMASISPALALPGRDLELISPETAINELLGLDLPFLNRKTFPFITLLDLPLVLKSMRTAAMNHA